MASADLDFATPISIPEQARAWPLGRMQLSVRLAHVLGNIGCERLGDLHGLTYEQIGEAKSCGRKTLNELHEFVKRLNDGKLTVPPISNPADGEKRRGATQLFVPQHARGWLAQRLQMSVRLANVLERMDVRLLGDLHGVSVEKVRATKNCGWQTVAELESIIHRVQTGELFDTEAANSDTPEPVKLVRSIDKEIDALPARPREFLLLYLGASGDAPLTLEEIGARYQVTRERVRQVRKKAVGQIGKGGASLAGQLSQSIAGQCIAAVQPLTPELLAEWLGAEQIAACRYPLPFYIRLIEKLAPDVPAWPEGQKSGGIANGRQPEISRHLKAILSDSDAGTMALDVALAKLKAVAELENLEAGEFLESLRRSKSLRVEFSPPDKFAMRLAKFGTRDWARRVLAQVERPLTPEEIIERGGQIFGNAFAPVTTFTLANTLKPADGFYLLDRRAYGLRRHIRLPQHLLTQVTADLYRLLRAENRPLSTAEAINEKLIEHASLTNAYELAQLLREDKRFIDLGRFLFALEVWGIEERAHVYDLIPKALAQAGHPATVSELSTALQRFRSMSVTAMPSLLRKHDEVLYYGCGYYGLRVWGDAAKRFLVSKQQFINRLIARSEPPLTFNCVCQMLEIPSSGELAERLWQTVKSLPKVTLKPLRQTPETLLTHKSWSLQHAIHAVLANAEHPLPAYEIQWALNERFKQTFGEKSIVEVERCLHQNKVFIRDARGNYFLDKHLERDETEAANIRQMCFEFLSDENQILGSDDLLERLAAEGIATENLSHDILATLLSNDESFEVEAGISIQADEHSH